MKMQFMSYQEREERGAFMEAVGITEGPFLVP